ncbi:MAG: anaerobic ribonucleoside-triphosphate reductase activating protein [Anaerolineae bacterium]
MKIAGLQRVTLIDYPGKVAATVFLAGCNLRCPYCHNQWMIDASKVTEIMSVADFLDWLDTRRGLLDGVCICGGEPTVSGDLPDLLRAIKDRGFSVKLDTNGTLPQRLGPMLEAGLVDYVAMDIKAPLDGRYALMAGVPGLSPEPVRRSIALLVSWGGAYELRTTVAPGLDEEDLLEIAATVAAVEPPPPWYLQAFEASDGVLPEVREQAHLSSEELEALLSRLRAVVPHVELRV